MCVWVVWRNTILQRGSLYEGSLYRVRILATTEATPFQCPITSPKTISVENCSGAQRGDENGHPPESIIHLVYSLIDNTDKTVTVDPCCWQRSWSPKRLLDHWSWWNDDVEVVAWFPLDRLGQLLLVVPRERRRLSVKYYHWLFRQNLPVVLLHHYYLSTVRLLKRGGPCTTTTPTGCCPRLRTPSTSPLKRRHAVSAWPVPSDGNNALMMIIT